MNTTAGGAADLLLKERQARRRHLLAWPLTLTRRADIGNKAAVRSKVYRASSSADKFGTKNERVLPVVHCGRAEAALVAVQPGGPEISTAEYLRAETVLINWERTEHRRDSSRYLRLPCFRRSEQRIDEEQDKVVSFISRGKGVNCEGEENEATAGCSAVSPSGGNVCRVCRTTQTEVRIHNITQRPTKTIKMQTNTTPEPAASDSNAEPGTEQEALRDELERLEDENEDLKVQI